MTQEHSIPCPVCSTKIHFEPLALVRGHKFSCSNCMSVVGIAQEALATAHETYEKYQELKRQALTAKSKHNHLNPR